MYVIHHGANVADTTANKQRSRGQKHFTPDEKQDTEPAKHKKNIRATSAICYGAPATCDSSVQLPMEAFTMLIFGIWTVR